MFLDRSATSPAAQVAPILTGDLEDAAQLAALAACSDVITFDWENIPGGALAPLETDAGASAAGGPRGFAGPPGGKGPVFKAAHSDDRTAAIDSKEQLVRAAENWGFRASSRRGAWAMTARVNCIALLEPDRGGLGRDRRPGLDLREISGLLARNLHRRRGPPQGKPCSIPSRRTHTVAASALQHRAIPQYQARAQRPNLSEARNERA